MPEKKPRGPGRRFVKGQSGNPGGRPRSVRTLLASLAGDDGEKLWRIAVEMAEGKYRRQVERYIPLTGAKFTATIAPTIKEQREALQMVLEHLCGRPAQAVKLTGEDGGPIKTETEVKSNAPIPDLDRLGQLTDLLTRVRAFAPSGGAEETSEAADTEVV